MEQNSQDSCARIVTARLPHNLSNRVGDINIKQIDLSDGSPPAHFSSQGILRLPQEPSELVGELSELNSCM